MRHTDLLPTDFPGGWWRAIGRQEKKGHGAGNPRPPDGAEFRNDPLLQGALLAAVLIQAFQVGIIAFHPAWGGAVTDWLRTALAWPGFILFVLVSLRLTRARHANSNAWWLLSAGFFAYAIGQTIWTIFDQLLAPGHLPMPGVWDIFYMLQYPCFFLALALLPGSTPTKQPGIIRAKRLLDITLLIASVTALSWYFLMAPLSVHAGRSPLQILTSLEYPIGDLGLLYGLALVFIFQRTHVINLTALRLFFAGCLCLIVADSWAAYQYTAIPYLAGRAPDGLWMAGYLFFMLAALVQLRTLQRQQPAHPEERPAAYGQRHTPFNPGRIIRFQVPFVMALLVSGAIIVRSVLGPVHGIHPFLPMLVSLGLLLLVTIRQSITMLENEHLLGERETARADEQTLRETNRRMDAFLSLVSHELKTPLTTMQLHLQLMRRRLQRLVAGRNTHSGPLQAGLLGMGEQVTATLEQWGRIDRLVNDLLVMSRIQADRLDLHCKPTDLAELVQGLVEEQRQAVSPRIITLVLPQEKQEPFNIDAWRVGQVLTNYLTNALKYSPPEQPLEVGVEITAQQGRVWVRDAGPGIPEDQQAHIWERFYRAPGIEVQSGSGIGLGLGLYISKNIIEQHGGQVGIQSAPGAGATFWFSLPRTNQEQQPPEARETFANRFGTAAGQ
jgi:signal transduction histidine kinase